jgi:hypothetical protein
MESIFKSVHSSFRCPASQIVGSLNSDPARQGSQPNVKPYRMSTERRRTTRANGTSGVTIVRTGRVQNGTNT